jgi:hypothetical protein
MKDKVQITYLLLTPKFRILRQHLHTWILWEISLTKQRTWKRGEVRAYRDLEVVKVEEERREEVHLSDDENGEWVGAAAARIYGQLVAWKGKRGNPNLPACTRLAFFACVHACPRNALAWFRRNVNFALASQMQLWGGPFAPEGLGSNTSVGNQSSDFGPM